VAQCEFGPRVPNSEAHTRAADFLFNSLKSTTDLTRRQQFTYFDSLTGETLRLMNLIASYNPENLRRVMLCAHWDSRPHSDMEPDSSKRHLPVLGANDGASGVAILLELGRLFHESPPPVGVDIVLFDGEDYGLSGAQSGWLIGSEYFAANMGSYRPRFAILIDMVGDSDLQIYREKYSQQYAADINDYIWGIARENNVGAFEDSVKHTVYDDHVSLLSDRIKAIDIIDFDYPHWHTQADTPDKCSPQSLATVGEVLLAAIYNKAVEKF
jgi:Zn-dependent M28 family amino/carboxypeptidase